MFRGLYPNRTLVPINAPSGNAWTPVNGMPITVPSRRCCRPASDVSSDNNKPPRQDTFAGRRVSEVSERTNRHVLTRDCARRGAPLCAPRRRGCPPAPPRPPVPLLSCPGRPEPSAEGCRRVTDNLNLAHSAASMQRVRSTVDTSWSCDLDGRLGAVARGEWGLVG